MEKWIATAERLPEKKGVYLVTEEWDGRKEKKHFVRMNMFDPATAGKWSSVTEGSTINRVTAWMDLPEAYTEPSAGELIKRRIAEVDAEYTGGGIYVYMGMMDDGTFFHALDTDCYDVEFLDTDPREAGDDAFYAEWQQEHTIKEYCDTEEVFDWFTKMYLMAFGSQSRDYIIDMIDYKQYLKDSGKL